MVDQLLYQDANMRTLFKSILAKNSDIALASLNILISIVKYYSLTSFNNEEWNNPEQRKKNEEKLESQPAVVMLVETLPGVVAELAKCKGFTVYEAKLVELVNAMVTLNSHKIFNCVKNTKYFEVLVDLMFRFEYCNIFGMMLEKLFIVVFRTERMINEEIKHYIFC